MILIGSRAAELRAPGLLKREAKDFDFVCHQDEFDRWCEKYDIQRAEIEKDTPDKKVVNFSGTMCEFEMIRPDHSSGDMYWISMANDEWAKTKFGLVPPLDFLFTLKASHRFLKNSPHFWKNLMDYHRMKSAGARIRPEYFDFLKRRESETYTYKHPNLNQTKATFFADDNINYVYDHDSIHAAVAHLEKPAYQYYAKDGEEVKSDKMKFFDLPEIIRVYGVIEEAATLAIERSLVPHPGVLSPEKAWKVAFSKVLTSITSGWFRTWAYENAPLVLNHWSQDKTLFWRNFQDGLKNGVVRYV